MFWLAVHFLFVYLTIYWLIFLLYLIRCNGDSTEHRIQSPRWSTIKSYFSEQKTTLFYIYWIFLPSTRFPPVCQVKCISSFFFCACTLSNLQKPIANIFCTEFLVRHQSTLQLRLIYIPCLASFFYWRNSLYKLTLTSRRVFGRVFPLCCSWICEKTEMNVWKLYKLLWMKIEEMPTTWTVGN